MLRKLMLGLLVSLSMVALTACGTGDTELGGTLVVYSPNSDGEIDGLLYYWGETRGVQIELVSAGTGEVLSRLTAEKDNPQADIQFGGMNLGVWTTNKDLYQEYIAEGDELLPAGYQNTTGFFTNYLLSGSNLLVNTDLEAEIGMTITSYADLLDPRLKGRIAMGNPAASSSAFAQLTNMLVVMGDGSYEDDAAWNFIEEFMQNLADPGGSPKILGSSSAIFRNTAAGEYVVGVTYEDPSVQLLTDGATNVRVVYPTEGAVWLPSATAIVAGAPNLANAQAFIDFLISDEGQEIVASLTNRPVNIDIPNTNPNMLPFSQINLAFDNIQYTADNRSALQQRWLDLAAKYGA
jgi:ABC-type Fe3+ transport system, periplasmic component